MSSDSCLREYHFVLRSDRRRVGSNAIARAFSLRLGDSKPVRIGRGSANDVVVESKAVSLFHAELRVLQLETETLPRVCIRDLSMNGSGLKLPRVKDVPHSGTMHLPKGKDVPLDNGATILIPMMLKMTQSSSDRSWLKIEFKKTAEEAELTVRKDSASKEERTKAESGKGKKRSRTSNLMNQNEEELQELRTNFVELLLQTRQIEHDTPYEEAAKMMRNNEDWNALEETSRRECYEIFVGHLATSAPHEPRKKVCGNKKSKGRKEDVQPPGRKSKTGHHRSSGRRDVERHEKRRRHLSRSRSRGRHK